MSNIDVKKDGRDILLVCAAIVTSTGLVSFLPASITPGYMVIGGVGLAFVSMKYM
jgi:hypothetical protein